MSTPSFEKAPWIEQESQKDIRIITEQEKEKEKTYSGFHEAEAAGLFKPGTEIEMECIKWPRYPSGKITAEKSREGYPKIIMPCPDNTEREITIYPGNYCNFKKIEQKNPEN